MWIISALPCLPYCGEERSQEWDNWYNYVKFKNKIKLKKKEWDNWCVISTMLHKLEDT